MYSGAAAAEKGWMTPVFKNFRPVSNLAFRDGPLENLWGGGGAKYKKKYLRKGKLNEKNSFTPINPKKYSCYGLKKLIQGI